MPIYLEISRLHRCVTIVARGRIAPDEIMGAAQQLLQAQVPEFAKVVDVAGASTDVDPEQVERIAALLQGRPDVKRGPVAFLVDRSRGEFARAFKATQGERPVQLFHSLHRRATGCGNFPRPNAAPPRDRGTTARRGTIRTDSPSCSVAASAATCRSGEAVPADAAA
jgi:hypothetical protein